MNLKTYLRRAIKFACFFAVIYGILLLLFRIFGDAELTVSTQTLIGVAIFGCIYPLIGFYKKQITCNPDKLNIPMIKERIELCGYRCIFQDDNILRFSYLQVAKKMLAAFEDTIEVKITENSIEIEGLRRDVTLLALKLKDKLT